MRVGSLCSGAGLLDLAALELFDGSSVAWHAEVAAAPARVLAHHWPDTPNLGDVGAIDWGRIEGVEVLTGGYPCQPFSNAGKRKGTHDERHIWPWIREAIRRIRPQFTLLENVAGHRSLGFDRVLGDMAEDRLHVRWTSLRASDVGAPHHRERVFILVTDRDGGRCGQSAGQSGAEATQVAPNFSGVGALPHTDSRKRDGNERAAGRYTVRREASTRCSTGLLADPHVSGSEPQQHGRGVDECGSQIDWGIYAPAVRRWERLTRNAPAPTELNTNGRRHLSPRFAEWMMGMPSGWVTSPEMGLTRAEQLRIIGNSVVPAQAVCAFRQLLSNSTFVEVS